MINRIPSSLMLQSIPVLQSEANNHAEDSSKSMDHLGIVAMVCKEIGLEEEIDRIVGVDPRQKVTCG